MKMHERYLFPLFALLAPAAVLYPRWGILYLVLSLTFCLNMYSVFPFPPVSMSDLAQLHVRAPYDLLVAGINLAVFVTFAALLLWDTRQAQRALAVARPVTTGVGS
jgi:hypothetical protein